MESKELFGSNYLLLKPEEASVVDLGRLLFSSKLSNRRFIECREEIQATDFRQRWLIFISVVAQILLLASRNSLKKVGDILEFSLNLLSCNGGFKGLFFNILRGKVKRPEKSSASYLSVVGFVDTRLDLDRNIKQNDAKYKGFLSMMASKISYENENFLCNAVQNHWNMEFLGLHSFWNDYQEQWSTQAIILQDKKWEPKLIVVAFRGTEPFDADQWRTDVDISWYHLPNVGRIHGGFMKALGLQKNSGWPREIDQTTHHSYAYYSIREKLRTMLEANTDAKFIVTGHSLGAALAILFAALLTIHEEAWLLDKLEGVYTFGQPRVGDYEFGEFMKDKLREYDVRYMRYVYSNDLVPRIPYDDKNLFFKHFGPCLYFNSLYQGQVLDEEPNKNYFSLFWVLPKILNAVWELIRGFLLPLVVGKSYTQTWIMTIIRFFGLMIPGIAEHLPTDYVNLTRLECLPELLELQNSEDSKAD
ncbi:hypothetical protein LR48_Vigan07g270400 [Vigna angularis]|uniref:Fungal lipase-type domain-containing protein n=1 Tax=Phaseolus angularis TaxID=3914 RepID=A0A0L9V1M8_PHAAN|nr:triacylglycerol lipase OBL1 [Vigna angularis]KAG2390358.1 uncharacterized protein HKW66_Vig0222360 [Vigna angularis]KOM49000.1 hypothetical protein LR48_Vigan07g270400 [Vigna angularis]